MKTYKELFFVLICLFLITSCKRESVVVEEASVHRPCDYSVEFNVNGLYENSDIEGFTIEDWRIADTCLHVVIKAMGVDGTNWEPKLIDPLFVLDSDPPKHTLKLILENNEEEYIEISKEFSFELVPYADGESTIEYTFENVGETFYYVY
tara:strand:- start:34 stop:483 length:450 start_codon:yes stop_codon:yes gene_type:complete